jgi:pimeloyl-ACP methyl ester carboxylesterase
LDQTDGSLEMGHGLLTYSASGEGPAVVAVHGFPGSVRDFRRLGEAAAGLRMIRLNMPGFAGSEPLRRAGDWDELVGVVAEAAAVLANGPFVIVGHSMGGLVALRVAARSTLCRGLVLLAPAGLRPHAAMRQLPSQAALQEMVVSEVERAKFYALMQTPIGARATRAEADTTLALLSTLDYAPSREAAHSLRVPVLGASCLDDPKIEPAVIVELLAALNTQRHLVYEQGGHAPQREHAAEIGAALVEFAQALVGP